VEESGTEAFYHEKGERPGEIAGPLAWPKPVAFWLD